MSQNTDSIEKGASKLSLNPNANEWKPSFSATEFVPSWMAPKPAAAPAPAAPAPAGMKSSLIRHHSNNYHRHHHR